VHDWMVNQPWRGEGKPQGIGAGNGLSIAACAPARNPENWVFAFKLWERTMSESVKLIVDAFVSLKDRVAMENLREHRQLLRKKLQDIDGIDVSTSLQLIESDLSEIEAGLVRLQ
jgi:hypothetical protein